MTFGEETCFARRERYFSVLTSSLTTMRFRACFIRFYGAMKWKIFVAFIIRQQLL
jgi:hypothetical protein